MRLSTIRADLGSDPFDVTVCGDEVPARKPDPAPYRQAMAGLRGAYQLSRFSALWRTVVLLFFAFIAGTLFFLLLLTLGALG